MKSVKLTIWVWQEWRGGVERRLKQVAKRKGWVLALTFCDPDHMGFSFEMGEPDPETGGLFALEVRQAVCMAMAAEASAVRGSEVHARSW